MNKLRWRIARDYQELKQEIMRYLDEHPRAGEKGGDKNESAGD